MKSNFFPIAWALKQSFKAGYNRAKFLSDVKAGLTVGVVAIPLAMALGIASGVAPQNGLYTAIIAGAVISLLGGSRFQISGPTAAFVVLLVPVVDKFGLSGLLLAGLLAGVFLVIMGLLRLADVIQYIPHPVTTGFTSGIAVVIAVIQLKEFMGLEFSRTPAHFVDRILLIVEALPQTNLFELGVGLGTILFIVLAVRYFKSVPAPITALVAITAITYVLQKFFPELYIATVGSRFSYFEGSEVMSGIPQGLPDFQWPWERSTPQLPAYGLTWTNIVEITPYALSIALLGAIESLLSAVVADGVTQTRHNPNAELIAQGAGNIICPFFGGIPATGAIARTMTNVRFGAYSPISGVIHAGVVLLSILILAPIINMVPMAALSAVLMFVAYNMAEKKNFISIVRHASLDDRVVLLVCFTLTVFTDMTVGVGVGGALAALLFIRRVANLTGSQIFGSEEIAENLHVEVPSDVIVYRIRGAMFFGAAQRAMDALGRVTSSPVKHVVVDLTSVDLMDSTGAVALDSVLKHILGAGRRVTIVVNNPNVRKFAEHVESVENGNANLKFATDLKTALAES